MPSFRRARLLLASAIVASAIAATPAPVGAAVVVSPNSNAVQVARAMATDTVAIQPSTTFVTRPLNGRSAGTVDGGQLAGFGVSVYGALSTGNVDDIPNPAELGSANLGGNAIAGRGATTRDVTTLRIDFTAGATANCLRFDYKFFSKELPANFGSVYNDGFVAELDTTNWSASATSAIDAPNNIAYDPGVRVTSVNTTGAYMTATDAAGTLFDGSLIAIGTGTGAGSAPLRAVAAMTPGSGVHQLYLSIFDQVSAGGDSAVLIDSLRAETVANPAVDCARPTPPSGGGGSPGAGGMFPIPGGASTLTLTTQVSGGTASAGSWILGATGPVTLRGIAGSAAVTGKDVTSGTYLLSVTGGSPTYTTRWSCEGATLIGRTLILAPGAKATCTLAARYVDPFLPKGTFVIADRVAKVGATVTYWSASWATKNKPSKGRTVPGFRGYASTVSTTPPSVGAAWRTTATTSAKPPRTLPRVIAVVVSSSIRTSGTRIAGNVVRIVLIRRGSTFGVGKVIAILTR